MAILKRINKYQGLKDIDVLVEESGLSSQYFNIYDVPTNIPQGRSSFLLAGSPYLKNFVELKVEILDSAGQTVYTEPIANYLEGNARRVSIEVYDDTAPGDGFLYIVGELKDNFRSISGQQQDNLEITDNFLPSGITGNDVPPDFKNIYNVRYIRPIFINTTIPNTEPIFFYQQPRVTVNEVLKGYVVETTVSSSYEITGSVSVDPIQGLEPKDPDPDPIDGYGTGMSDGARDEVGRQLEVFKNRRKNKIDPLRNNRFSKSGRLTRRASPEIDRFTISVTDMETSPENTTSDAVTSAFVGGEITINNPTVNSTQYPSDEYTIPSQYKSSIKKVNNEKTLVPLDDFIITKKDTGEKIPVKIEQTANNVTMSVIPTPPQTISTTHFRSYADITVGNLHTFSGDVYKAKIYARSKGTLGDFEPVYDASIESPQVLIDAYSPTGFKNIGYFYTQSIVDNYWVTSSNSTATQDNSQFIDGVLLSGSNAGFTPKNSTVNTVEFNTSHSYNLETSVPYTVEFNAYYYKENKEDESGNVTKEAELEVYLSGSAITGGSENDHTLGKVVVGENQDEGQVLGIHNTFTSAGSGSPNTHLKFKATSGRWIIQDIMLRPHSETNFNPTYFRTIVPMEHPLPKKPDDYDFLVEFYDLNNNIAETISVSEDNTFAGAPQNIDGEDNLLSGSLFVGNAQGSGFEMAGASSAYIRSLTYEGFDKTIASSSGGFMMWSGSVGGRLSSSEDYDGVGLEIVDAHGATDRYLQFKTNPSTFKVQTDEFFLGSSTQFISGSNSNIEISSSNFHLTPEGDVTMSGTITATAGNIGDWTISGGDIVGANITMDADGSRIYKTDDNGNLDGYYMDFTPGSNYYIRFGTNFAVSSSGTLIAEGAVIEGVLTSSEGLIANWTIASDSIHKLTSGKYTGLSSTGDTRFFGGASSLTATGSAPFNVKATGDITGSSVLFTGGKIAGWDIDTTTISSADGKILLDGSNDLIRVGANASNNVKVVGTATQGYIHTGKTSATSTTAGFWLANNAGDPEFHVGNSTDYLKFDGGDLNITSQNLEISSSTLQMSTAQASMSLGHTGANPYGKIIVEGAGTPTFTVGPDAHFISMTTGSGIYMDGDGNFKFGDSDGQIKFQDGSFSITGSDVAINVADINISASGFELSSTQASMSLGTNKQWLAYGGNTNPYLSVGQSTAGYGNTGVFLGYVSSVSRPRVSFVGSTGHFKVDQDVDIKTETFELDANSGDLQISSAHKSMSLNDGTIILDGPNKKIKVGSTNAVTIQGGGNGGVDNYIVMGSKADFSDYDKSTQGIIMGMDTSVPKFEMAKSSTNYLRWDTTSGLDLATEAMEVSASNIQISSAQASMSIGPSQTNPIVLQSLGNDRFLKFGGKTDFDQTGTAGFIMGIDNGTAKFDFTVGSSNDNYFRIDGSGVDIKTDKFELDTTTLDISSTNRRITIFDTDGTTEWVRIGEISTDASDLYGIKVWDGTGTNDATDLIAMFGEQGNKIAGWEITGTQLRSIPDAGLGGQFAEGENGLILHSSGRIESADFATNLKGWRIDTLGNGTAEFENARIRGTLATAVFEKESVNVVGGQLMVANSTTLQPLRSGSAIIAGNSGSSATDVTMSFANVSGFISGEILKAKKVGQTGFSVEYLQVTGSKRYSSDPALAHITGSQIDPDGLAGEIYVGRGYGQVTNISSSVGTLDGAMSDTATYSTSQSIVLDLGSNVVNIQDVLKIDTEKFKIISGSITGNTGANQTIEVLRDFHNTDPDSHSDGATVYKINGDNEFLQGLVSTPVEYNEGQVFVSTGKYDASADLSSGYILMNANPNDNSTPYMDIVERTGSGVYDLQLRTRLGDLSGLSSAYLYGDEEPGFGLYTENGFFRGTLHAMTGSIHGILHVATQQGGIETNQKISIGTNVSGTDDGIYINNNNYWFTDATFKVGSSNYYLQNDASGNITIHPKTFELDADTGELQISSTEHSMSFNDDDILIHAKDSGGSHIKVGRNVDRAITISGSQYHGAIYSGKANVTDTTAGFWLANNNTDPEFHLGNSTNFVKYDGGALSMTTQTFELDAGTGDLQLSSGNTSMSFADNSIKIGATSAGSGVGYLQVGQDITKAIQITGSNTVGSIRSVKDSFTDNTAGFWIANNNGTQEFYVGTATEHIKFDGNNMSLAGDNISLSATTVDVTTGTMKVDADDFQINSTIPSMSLGYDSNTNAGLTFVGGSPTQILFGPSGSEQMRLEKNTTDSFLQIGSVTFDSGTSNAGIIIGSDGGTAELHLVTDANKYFKYDGDELDIRTTKFRVNTGGGFDISGTSGTGTNNFLKLGSATTVDLGEGFYADGGGNFRIGDATSGGTDYLKFTPSGNLVIKSSDIDITAGTFTLDATELYISSANQRIAIGADGSDVTYNSSGIFLGKDGSGVYKFSLKSASGDSLTWDGAGTLTITGNVTADSGNIGGWTIDGNNVQRGASSPNLVLGTTGGNKWGLWLDNNANGHNYWNIDEDDNNVSFRVGGSTNYISAEIGNATGSIRLKSQDLTLASPHFTASSDHGGYLSMPATASAAGSPTTDTWKDQNGVWLSGSGDFNLQSHPTKYIRSDGGEFSVNTPNFSIDNSGNMIASNATFEGDISAKSGFFGQNTGSGWNIDAATIRDDNSSIVIDGTAGSPNITITSASFAAEMVPDITPGSTILAGGGNTYDTSQQGWASGTYIEDTSTESDISNGNGLSSKLQLFQGFTNVIGSGSGDGGDTAGAANEAELTGPNRAYKSTVTVYVMATLDSTLNHAGPPASSYMMFGLAEYMMTLQLYNVTDGNATAHNEIISGSWFPDIEFGTSGGWVAHSSHYDYNLVRSISRTVNHEVGTNNDAYEWRVVDFNIKNNNLQETYTNSHSGKTTTYTVNMEKAGVRITAAAHTPSNKKVEIAPAGFQAVFLQEDTVEHADNKYFRVTPAEDKTVDILGTTVITGSLSVKTISDSDVTTIGSDISTGGSATVTEQIQGAEYWFGNGSADRFWFADGTGIKVNVNSNYDFLFAEGGNFHADADLIGFSGTTSDIKFKENVLPIHDALFKVKQLRGVEFDWKDEYKDRGHDLGFIAQEVESVDGLGVLVKDDYNIRTEKNAKILSYEKVVPLLVEAIKEQQTQIEELQSKVEKLDGSIG